MSLVSSMMEGVWKPNQPGSGLWAHLCRPLHLEMRKLTPKEKAEKHLERELELETPGPLPTSLARSLPGSGTAGTLQ